MKTLPGASTIRSRKRSIATTRTSTDLTWTCDICHLSIADGGGYVILAYDDLDRYHSKISQREGRALNDSASPNGNGLSARLLSNDIKEYANVAKWQVLHARCNPRPHSSGYAIHVERIRTSSQSHEWTLHLLEKGWLDDTNWSSLMRNVVSARVGRG